MLSLNERLTAANNLLAPYAVPHSGRLGRAHAEPDDETRFPFQRDRDRIIHTQSFRRLKGKTQVFVAGEGDHYRTRLTHTLEVAQLSRDCARTLGLNEDLSEAIALAHDLGHPPFGHAGEEALDRFLRAHGSSFEHNAQSLRIVTLLEEHSSLTPGLNLNREILEGLWKHRSADDAPPRSPSLEAQVVNIADEIAYSGHDSDDGLRAGLFSVSDLSRTRPGKRAAELATPRGTSMRGAIIHILVEDVYREAAATLSNIHSLDNVYAATHPLIKNSTGTSEDLLELRAFLWEKMYLNPAVSQANEEGKAIVLRLCETYLKNPNDKVLALQKKFSSALPEAVKDYVAGMTDEYAKTSCLLVC